MFWRSPAFVLVFFKAKWYRLGGFSRENREHVNFLPKSVSISLAFAQMNIDLDRQHLSNLHSEHFHSCLGLDVALYQVIWVLGLWGAVNSVSC